MVNLRRVFSNIDGIRSDNFISETFYSFYEFWFVFKGFFNFISQIADIYFYGVGENISIVVPDVIDKGLFADDFIFISQ